MKQELKAEKFVNPLALTEWVNKNKNVEVVSICFINSSTILFYTDK